MYCMPVAMLFRSFICQYLFLSLAVPTGVPVEVRLYRSVIECVISTTCSTELIPSQLALRVELVSKTLTLELQWQY